MITIKNLSKTFNTPTGKVEVLKNINLEIKDGDIFGIVGFSGAGKSTLIRCLNGLEKADKGSIIIGDNEITKLNKKQLRNARKKIGMIFQQFNLFDSKTVYENVAFPLEISGYKKEEIKERVNNILKLVELEGKKDAYPLLDPQTTYSILELLKDINKKLNLTIVIITHELDVLKYATKNMAVLEQGRIVETGTTESLFLNPTSNTLKNFINISESFLKNKEFVGGDGI